MFARLSTGTTTSRTRGHRSPVSTGGSLAPPSPPGCQAAPRAHRVHPPAPRDGARLDSTRRSSRIDFCCSYPRLLTRAASSSLSRLRDHRLGGRQRWQRCASRPPFSFVLFCTVGFDACMFGEAHPSPCVVFSHVAWAATSPGNGMQAAAGPGHFNVRPPRTPPAGYQNIRIARPRLKTHLLRLWVSRVSSGCGTRYTSARNNSPFKVLLWPVRDNCIVVGSLERVLRETPKFPKPLFEVLGKTTNFEHFSQS